jgi:hypothetical protein
MILVDKNKTFWVITVLLFQIHITVFGQCTLIQKQPTDQSDCDGNSVSYSVTPWVGSGTIRYQWWQKHPTEQEFKPISSATNANITIPNIGSAAAPDQTQYRCTLTDTKGCSQTSSVVSLLVNKILFTVASQTVCEGAKATFEVNTKETIGTIRSISWQKRSGTTGTWTDLEGSQTLIIDKVNTSNEAYYRCKVTFQNTDGSTCIRYSSTGNGAKLSIAYLQNAQVSYISACMGSTTNLQMQACNSPYIGTWFTNKTDAEAISKGLTYNYKALQNKSIVYYSCSLAGSPSCKNKDSVVVTSLPAPLGTQLLWNKKLNFCDGESVLFSIKNKDPKLTYTWYDKSTADTLRVSNSAQVQVTAKGENGCNSFPNEIISTTKVKTPSKPVVNRTNYYTLSVSKPDTSYQYLWKNFKGEDLTTGVQLQLNNGGKYMVQASYTHPELNLTCRSKITETYIELSEKINIFRTYPNPTKNTFLFVEFKEKQKNILLKIFQKNGQLLLSQKIEDEKLLEKISLKTLHKGSYLLNLSIGNKQHYSTLVIE